MSKKKVSTTGRRQRPSFSDAQVHLTANLGPYEAGKKISLKDAKLYLEMNGKVIPDISNSWISSAESKCLGPLNEQSKMLLVDTVMSYHVARHGIVSSASYASIASILQKMETAAAGLLDAIEVYEHDHVLAWEFFERLSEPKVQRDDIYPSVSALVRQTHLVSKEFASHYSEKQHSTIDVIATWEQFICGLVGVFESNNFPVKVTKSRGRSEDRLADHPSAFVNFVWEILKALPKDYREHMDGDIWTLADAMHTSVSTKRAKNPRVKR